MFALERHYDEKVNNGTSGIRCHKAITVTLTLTN